MIKGKKLLVTGATGEVARAIALAYAADNEVWAAARFTDAEARKNLETGGIRTFAWALGSDKFEGLPRDFDYVIHSACTIFPVANDYDATIRENAEGTGLLMEHIRDSTALLYISTMQIYAAIEDCSVPRKETDPLGCHPGYAPSYSIGKVATEGVVRTLARIYNLPTTIGRLGMNYGVGCSGAVDFYLRDMLEGKTLRVPPRGVSHNPLVHNSDIVDWVEPLLAAASVPATIVNFTGDEGVEEREMVDYLAKMSGLQPEYIVDPDAGYRGGTPDCTRRLKITGPSRNWRPSFLEMARANYPEHSFQEVE